MGSGVYFSVELTALVAVATGLEIRSHNVVAGIKKETTERRVTNGTIDIA